MAKIADRTIWNAVRWQTTRNVCYIVSVELWFRQGQVVDVVRDILIWTINLPKEENRDDVFRLVQKGEQNG